MNRQAITHPKWAAFIASGRMGNGARVLDGVGQRLRNGPPPKGAGSVGLPWACVAGKECDGRVSGCAGGGLGGNRIGAGGKYEHDDGAGNDAPPLVVAIAANGTLFVDRAPAIGV